MGFLFHTIRFTNNPRWQPWGDVGGPAGEIGNGGVVGCAELNGDLHVLASGPMRPSLQHAIRITASSSWQPFNNVEATAAGTAGGIIRGVAASHLGGDVHVVGTAAPPSPFPPNRPSVGKVIHTIRFTQALAWQPFGDVTATQAGNPSRPPNRFESIACAELGGDLHLIVSSGDELFHTIRFTRQLAWQPFVNVNSLVGPGKSFLDSVSCAGVLGDLHVVAPDTNGVLWHTVRRSTNPSWQRVDNVCVAAGKPELRFLRVACAEVGTDLHVVGVTLYGELFHTILFSIPSPGWQPFASLTNVLGPFGPWQSRWGIEVSDIACAGVSGDLHVCIAALNARPR